MVLVLFVTFVATEDLHEIWDDKLHKFKLNNLFISKDLLVQVLLLFFTSFPQPRVNSIHGKPFRIAIENRFKNN